jgi:hypothetical protein
MRGTQAIRRKDKPVKPASATERLEREIGNAHTSINSALASRRDHPSYGYTKTELRASLHRLEGMITAWLYVTGRWDHAGSVVFYDHTAATVRDALGIDLAELHARVKGA